MGFTSLSLTLIIGTKTQKSLQGKVASSCYATFYPFFLYSFNKLTLHNNIRGIKFSQIHILCNTFFLFCALFYVNNLLQQPKN